jgi:biopolymer transport protein ExbD
LNFQRKKREKVDITVISMIDVLFVLLLFFMISTTFNRKTEVNIKLPEAKGDAAKSNVKMTTLNIDANGIYGLGSGDETPHPFANQQLDTIKQELSRLPPESRELPFIINADAKTPHQAVISVLEAASETGFTHITFSALKPQNSP